MTDWVRLWHDMPTDPKWRVIARKSGQRVGDVMSVFTMMMCNASANADNRGTLLSWDDEDVGAVLDIDVEAVTAIRTAMEGKVLEGDRLKGWDRRQVDCRNGSVSRNSEAYIYVIKNSRTASVKIGVSKNPWARAKDLQTGATGDTTVVATFKGIRADEVLVHDLLKEFRRKGEWFVLPKDILAFLQTASDGKNPISHVIEQLPSQLRKSTRSYEEADAETETDSSVSKDTALIDPEKVMFDAGVALITSCGKSEGSARAWLGKAKRDHGAEAVITMIGRAKREGAPDPIAFMEGGFRAGGRVVAVVGL